MSAGVQETSVAAAGTAQDVIHLSGLACVHGAAHPVSGLGAEMTIDLTLPSHGLSQYRASDHAIWELAAQAAESALAQGGGTPDLLVYVSENDRSATESLASLARRLGLANVEYLAVSGHGCGNLGPALEIARDAVLRKAHRRVLLVMADAVHGHGRVMTTGLSVFSDGAAACIVTAERPAGASFAIHHIATQVGVGDGGNDPGAQILSTVGLGSTGMERIARATGRRPSDFRFVTFPNYRLSSIRFLAAAIGFSESQLLLGPIAEFGHSFSADVIANLEIFAGAGRIERGDRVLVCITGPYTWSMMDVEYV